MRIFKQKKPFDYEGVIKEVYDALQELIKPYYAKASKGRPQ